MTLTITAATLEAWRPLVPERSSLPSPPRRLVFHWTGGYHRPNDDFDRKAYHFLVTGPDGWISAGRYPVAANMAPLAANYAMHTGGMNTGSIGLSWCGMAKSDVARGRMGPAPITLPQLHRGLAFAAFLALEMHLDVGNPAQAHTHREAWELHGVKGRENDTKPDWVVLPPIPGVVGWKACGGWMRATAAAYATQIRALTGGSIGSVAPTTPATTPTRSWVVVTTSSLNLRQGPGQAFAEVATAPQGTRLVVDAYTADGVLWYRTVDGLWAWAGGTDRPLRGAA